jgi:amino-acid N-acetyltransferase
MCFKIQKAKNKQIDEIKILLAKHMLPIDDIKNGHIDFLAVTQKQKVIGVIGVELYQNTGLLRSLVVDPEYRNQRLGKKLVEALFQNCISNKVDELYLLTSTAVLFFEKLGFRSVERENVPNSIMQTEQFKTLCPSLSIVMFKKIN